MSKMTSSEIRDEIIAEARGFTTLNWETVNIRTKTLCIDDFIGLLNEFEKTVKDEMSDDFTDEMKNIRDKLEL
jgi:hypothetical protein